MSKKARLKQLKKRVKSLIGQKVAITLKLRGGSFLVRGLISGYSEKVLSLGEAALVTKVSVGDLRPEEEEPILSFLDIRLKDIKTLNQPIWAFAPTWLEQVDLDNAAVDTPTKQNLTQPSSEPAEPLSVVETPPLQQNVDKMRAQETAKRLGEEMERMLTATKVAPYVGCRSQEETRLFETLLPRVMAQNPNQDDKQIVDRVVSMVLAVGERANKGGADSILAQPKPE